jgi:hypothetical protein
MRNIARSRRQAFFLQYRGVLKFEGGVYHFLPIRETEADLGRTIYPFRVPYRCLGPKLCVRISGADLQIALEAHRYCRRFCDGQSLYVQREPTTFNKEGATGSVLISYKPSISTDFHSVPSGALSRRQFAPIVRCFSDQFLRRPNYESRL